MRAITFAAVAALAACKPPPTDAGLDRELPEPATDYASDPLPSPQTQGAVWAVSAAGTDRIVYGVRGEPALITLTCQSGKGLPRVQITRLSRADEGAGALLAFVGNGHIGRLEVDAVEVNGRTIWQGETLAADVALEPLAGPRQLTATIPGAGMVRLNPSPLPGQWLQSCRES